jgi:hypothetical protein
LSRFFRGLRVPLLRFDSSSGRSGPLPFRSVPLVPREAADFDKSPEIASIVGVTVMESAVSRFTDVVAAEADIVDRREPRGFRFDGLDK